MKELWLNFKDESGEAIRVLVEGEKFAIGRTSDNDLQIPISSLSRQHAKIERYADVFIVSDCGSSNGSTLNGETLEKPVALKDGDILNLGDSVEIQIEVRSEKDTKSVHNAGAGASTDEDAKTELAPTAKAEAVSNAPSSSGGGSGVMWMLLAAPVFMVLVLIGLAGAILLVRDRRNAEIGKTGTDFDTPFEYETETISPSPKTILSPTLPSNSSSVNSSPINSSPPTPSQPAETPSIPTTSGDNEKIKAAAAGFVRRIAKNDPRAFLLEKQVALVTPKINQLRGSAVLADNIKNAKKNSSKIIELAQAKSLRPQFLAVAALTKLGGQRGDVAATAAGIVDSLSDIVENFGNDNFDDSLLIIAAHSTNTTYAQLQSKVGNSAGGDVMYREARSIWFLKDRNKLTDGEFNYALQFLAIGTITQNPKDFNVSADALVL